MCVCKNLSLFSRVVSGKVETSFVGFMSIKFLVFKLSPDQKRTSWLIRENRRKIRIRIRREHVIKTLYAGGGKSW